MNLQVGTLNLGEVVINSKREKIDEGIVEHRTVGGDLRLQPLFYKYKFTFDCLSNVQNFYSLVDLVVTNPIQTIIYDNFRETEIGVECYVKITEESFEKWNRGNLNLPDNEKYIDFSFECEEI